jgi:hypothetical protein
VAFSPATLTYLCVVYIWRPRHGVITSVSPHLTFAQDISDGSSRNLWYGSSGLMCLPRSYCVPRFFVSVYIIAVVSALFLSHARTHARTHTHTYTNTNTFFFYVTDTSSSYMVWPFWICVTVIQRKVIQNTIKSYLQNSLCKRVKYFLTSVLIYVSISLSKLRGRKIRKRCLEIYCELLSVYEVSRCVVVKVFVNTLFKPWNIWAVAGRVSLILA